MGTVEWVLIGFIIFIMIIILTAYLIARWLYKEQKESEN